MTQHRHLLSPLTLRGHTLRNRIVFGAHTANMSDLGLPGPRRRSRRDSDPGRRRWRGG